MVNEVKESVQFENTTNTSSKQDAHSETAITIDGNLEIKDIKY